MYHFFVSPEQVGADRITIIGNDVNHIKNVLRMKPGEEICINDGRLEYLCRVEAFTEDQVIAGITGRSETGSELPVRVCLFQGLPKGDKMETIIQKCVELGVDEIVPVAMKRCVVKLDAKKEEGKRKRWQLISESAAKQAGRGKIPGIHELMDYEQALKYASEMDVFLLPYEKAENMDITRKLIGAVKPGQSAAVLIGPEGGFEEQEILKAEKAGARAITLGRRILRTETAGMAVMAMFGYELEP